MRRMRARYALIAILVMRRMRARYALIAILVMRRMRARYALIAILVVTNCKSGLSLCYIIAYVCMIPLYDLLISANVLLIVALISGVRQSTGIVVWQGAWIYMDQLSMPTANVLYNSVNRQCRTSVSNSETDRIRLSADTCRTSVSNISVKRFI